MKKFSIFNLFSTLVLIASALLASSCAADDEIEAVAPAIETGNATEITRTGAILSGEIKCDSQPEEFGIAWSTVPDIKMSLSSTKKVPCTGEVSNGKLAFSAIISDLKNGNTYYYCTYSFNGVNYALGDVRSFTTAENSGPSFDVLTLDSFNESMMDVSSRITENGGAPILLTGFIYKQVTGDANNQPLISYGQDGVQVVQVELDDKNSLGIQIYDLQPNRDYVVRAFGVSAGIGYSEQIVVHTQASETPSVSATTVQPISGSTFMLQADISNPGTTDVTERGFVYSMENQRPTTESSNLLVAPSNGNRIESELSGLERGRTYYVRAFATNAAGTAYGPVATIETEAIKDTVITIDPVVIDPVAFTITANEVTSSTAIVFGHVTSNSNNIVRCGFIVNGASIVASEWNVTDGPFQLKLENLEPLTVYHYQAFIETEDGRRFLGAELQFTTTKLAPSFDDQKFPDFQ